MKQKHKRNETEGTQPNPDDVCHNCDFCEFKCRNKVTMNKHVNTKHGNESDIIRNKSESLNQFITRLGLEKYDRQYREYFKENDFEKGKDFVEKMVMVYGEDFVPDIAE